MKADTEYMRKLATAWAGGATVAPVLPAAVAPASVWNLLCAHNVEVGLGSLLPNEVRPAGAAATLAQSRRRTELLLLECERILPFITGADGRAVLLKGAALALGTYKRPTDRWFLDLDILVPRDRVEPTCAALAQVGYRPLQGKRDPVYYDQHHLHRIMVGPQGAVLEIHWDLTLPQSVYRHDPAGVFARADVRPLGRLQAACASPVDQVLHGVYQNIADGFLDLRRVLDLVLLVKGFGPAEWGQVVDLAHQGGQTKALWLSLHNMKEVAGVAAPTGVMAELRPRLNTRRTLLGLDPARNCLERRAGRKPGYVPLLHLLLTPTPSQQWRELRRAATVSEQLLLEMGHRPDRLPGWARRFRIGVSQWHTLFRAGLLAARGWTAG